MNLATEVAAAHSEPNHECHLSSCGFLAEQLVEIRRSQGEHLALDLQDLQDQLKVPLEMIVKQVLGAQQVPDDFIDGLLLQTRMQTNHQTTPTPKE